jgi:HK97 family phage portal protein
MGIRDWLSSVLRGEPRYLRRFQVSNDELATTRPPVSARLADWQSTVPQYPPSNFRTFSTFGYRQNPVFRRCVDLLCDAACQADLVVLDDRTDRPVIGHPMIDVFRRPAPRVTQATLWTRFVQDAYTTGNAFWELVRDEEGQVVELWRLDPQRVAIQPGVNGVPARYLYSVNGQWLPIPAEDVLHWRFVDPLQPWWGVPPIYSAFRDLSVDNKLTDHFQVSLQNFGVPAVVLEHNEEINAEDAERARRSWMAKYSGFRRGEPAIVGRGTKVNVIGMDLSKMAIGDLSSTSETRIAMVHGTPMILLGRSGTQGDPTRANYAESKEHFWTDTVTPLLSKVAGEISAGILWPNWDTDAILRADFDISSVPVLQEARLRRGKQAAEIFTAGVVSRWEAQRLAGFKLHGPDVFYRSSNVAGIIPANSDVEVLELTEA